LVIVTFESGSRPIVEFRRPDTLLAVEGDPVEKQFGRKVLRHILAGSEMWLVDADAPAPQRYPDTLRLYQSEIPEFLQHFQQIERVHAQRFRFVDGMQFIRHLYPKREVRTVLDLSHLGKLDVEKDLPHLVCGASVERVLLCDDKADFENVERASRDKLSALVRLHREARSPLRVAYMDKIRGSLGRVPTDFSVVGRDLLLVCEDLVELIVEEERRLCVSGYASWRPADVEVHEYLFSRVWAAAERL
jgi:hypothetical protein